MIGTFHSMLSHAVKRIIRNCYLSLFFGVKRDRSVDYNLLTPVLMFQFYQLFPLILIFYPEDLTNQLDDLSIFSVSTWHNIWKFLWFSRNMWEGVGMKLKTSLRVQVSTEKEKKWSNCCFAAEFQKFWNAFSD